MIHQKGMPWQTDFRVSLSKAVLAEIAAALAHLQLAQPKATPQVNT
jgi:hypothetical protein